MINSRLARIKVSEVMVTDEWIVKSPTGIMNGSVIAINYVY